MDHTWPEGSVVATGESTEANWKVTTPLERGKFYSWRLVARKGDSEFVAPSRDEHLAVFRVLDESALAAVVQQESEVGDSQLLRLVIYWQSGLRHEAESVIGPLQEQNPGSEVVRRLAHQIRARDVHDSNTDH